ncbi:hypothetical protein FSARC_1810 [Fusarium sarcochroum]|uniref:Uncharacterized protein n=1 Tax=Fusarium sarcochroum TaxID=1208366 RepID=A0A8H4U8E6_9HYPO|nr:hypothetical protein FSARC_1810 [Fusarium sarcochroum]
MNWTEGALARHSRRKGWDKDAARQKQYFAKARARKHAPSSNKALDVISFVPDYIPQPQPAQDGHLASSTPRQKQKTPRRRLVQKQHDVARKAGRQPARDDSNLHLGKGVTETQHSSVSPLDKDRQELDIVAKRRKLLEKADWTGISTQKPLLADFSWQRDHVIKPIAKPTSRRDHRSSRALDGPVPNHHLNERRLGRLSENDMRINIGSQNLRWSRESNSVRSSATRQDLFPGLDNSTRNQNALQLPISPYQQNSSAHMNSRVSTSHRHSDESLASFEPHNSLLNFSIAPQHPEHRHIKQATKTHGESNELRHVVRSSTPVIHHPQPTRERRIPMFNLRSPDLQEDMSTIAVLGASTQPSHRITAEDIQWNKWLNSNSKATPQQPIEMNQDQQSLVSISPGISNYWDTSEDQPRTKSSSNREASRQSVLHRVDEPLLRSSDTYSSSIPLSDNLQRETFDTGSELPELHVEDSLSSIERARSSWILPTSSSYGRSEPSIRPGSDLVLPAGVHLPMTPNVQDLLDLLTASEEQQEAMSEHQEERETTPNTEDEDEIWKRFVFDDDSAEINRKAREEAHEQTKFDLGFKKSDLPHAFIESSLASGSIAPASDIAEPPSASRDRSSPTAERTPNMIDALTEDLSDVGMVTSSSEAAAKINATDATDSIIAQPASPQPLQAEFRFHHPQLFVGRLANDVPSNPSSVPLYAPPKKGRRPRSGRRRDKGRPGIRAMPNYDDDPIEED